MDRRIKRSRAQEEKTAILHGGKRQPGSGSGWMRKGDVRTKYTLIETKRTDAQQITLRRVDLEKIWVEAWAEGRVPIIGFELCGRRYIVLSEDDYLEDHGGGTAAPAVDGEGQMPGGRPQVLLPRPGRPVLRDRSQRQGRL